MTKKDFIQTLIDDAQKNIWKNELVVEYKKKDDENFDATSTEEIIKRDQEYIKFLMVQMAIAE